ncbi:MULTISPECIES: TonB C-terminal domain-containing protein [Acinetobacter]|uniref:TonB C-terminal domain-containing protein n=1 Tax=Acinetobacter TaxID=469 RepID=UPI00019ADB25|nr:MULTISPECIES: TonB C-terminal domain-containing protein [Acinetobacter]EEH70170.1 TonB family domain protein [Acinetobacter sp. ATCC 27244]NAR29500.1 energy transducer TonB [Acinetobacter haemolyticus]NAR46045.1 energy transducer TonB [Acinetobacter haemolyticus]NAR58582.1 energy transducer TonB [Acinetobacter haemolyticus]NAR75684.1 energy transducer TonB [Acinetobacter haemolyticus]
MRLFPKIVCVLFCIWGGIIHAKNIEFINVDRHVIKWKKIPQILFSPSVLQGKDRDLNVVIDVNEKGEVVALRIKESSGIAELDALVMTEIKKYSLYPYEINGKYYPVRVEQPFKFLINSDQVSDPALKEIDRRKLIEDRMHKEIMDLWDVPAGSENLSNLVRFNISRNNSIDSIQILQSSGNRSFDLSTRQAVRYSTLVKKLTNDEKNAFFGGLESRMITISFRAK